MMVCSLVLLGVGVGVVVGGGMGLCSLLMLLLGCDGVGFFGFGGVVVGVLLCSGKVVECMELLLCLRIVRVVRKLLILFL